MEKEGAADPKGVMPMKPWAGVEGVPKDRLLPAVPTPGAGVLCPKVGVEVPPNTSLFSAALATLKANGVLWLAVPRVLWGSAPPNGAPAPVVPLCPAPKLKVPEVELVPGAAALSPKPPLLLPVAPDAPKVNGDWAELLKAALLAPLLAVWVVVPKPEVVAVPKEKTVAVLLPKAGCVLAGAPNMALTAFRPPKVDCTELPKAVGAGAGAGAAEFPNVKELPKLGSRAGAAEPCCCPSVAPNVGWGLAPGYGGGGTGGLVAEPKGMLNAGVVV